RGDDLRRVDRGGGVGAGGEEGEGEGGSDHAGRIRPRAHIAHAVSACQSYAPEMGPRFLYLHGFASSPASRKAVFLRAHFEARGATLEVLDARVPSLERLRLSEILRVAGAAIGGPAERVAVIGSSLGGLAAARLAERDARVAALVLLAPAFRLAERWRQGLG